MSTPWNEIGSAVRNMNHNALGVASKVEEDTLA